MYGNGNWYKDPLTWIPIAILWCALEMIATHFGVAEKLSQGNSFKKRNIQKVIHIVCFFVSAVIVTGILLTIDAITGIDLLEAIGKVIDR